MVRSECQRSIQYGDARIALTVSFAPIAVNRVAISVLPDGQVEVLAPEGTSLEEVMQAVRKRLRWIWQRLEAGHERRVHVLPREYVSGESHLYLGRRHLLKVHAAYGARGGVKMLRGRLDVVVPEGKPEAVKALLDAWYRQRASEVFSRRLQHCVDQARWLKKAARFAAVEDEDAVGKLFSQGRTDFESLAGQGAQHLHRLCFEP